MRKVVVISGPGLALGEAARWVAERAGVPCFGLGDLMRKYVQGPMGEPVRRLVNEHQRVPDELMAGIVAERLVAEEGGWVLYGFACIVVQAELLARHGCEPNSVVEVVLSEHEASERLKRTCTQCRTSWHVYYRLPRVAGVCDLCGGGLDLPDEVIAERIGQYKQHAESLRTYFRERGVSFETISDPYIIET
ncbi:adenylate kinase family protein [Allorhizocola rhizosphaerae]|uniref:adenylate kinase family protein n=1 Tax=Allorhizocola rhizosphaerae TaxID=1872709 RepID=UPI0013C2D8AB|nr:nucleoside monophosphate kinase [Allorhizocola rhizosphaerae]